MPTYDYECRSCGNRVEVIHGMTEPGPSACERCGGPMRRILHPAGIIFKGSGFYKTDSRSAGGSADAPAPDHAKVAKPEPAAPGNRGAAPPADAGGAAKSGGSTAGSSGGND